MRIKKLKIAYVTMVWPSPSETFCARDILSLKSLGCDVSVFSLKPALKNQKDLKRANHVLDVSESSMTLFKYLQGVLLSILNLNILISLLYILILKERKVVYLLKSLILIPSSFYIVHSVIKLKPDITHLFWGHYPSLVGYILKRKDTNIKLSMFLGAYDLTANYFISKKMSRLVDVKFTHAKANREYLDQNEYNASEFEVIYRGLDLSQLPKYTERVSNKKLIVVSRLIKDKKIDQTIELVKRLRDIGEDYSLTIIGSGPETDNLKSLVKSYCLEDRVYLKGYLEPEKIFNELKKATFFIFPSQKSGERLPNAVKEAMYSGLVTFAYHTPGMDELIENKEEGFVFKTFNINEIADIICNLKNEDIENIAKRASDKVEALFDSSKNMKEYLTKWNKIISEE